jgi:hypothetical protein
MPSGVVHNDKIFFVNDENPPVFDPKNNSWSKWPTPTKPTSELSCMISWKDSILLFSLFRLFSFNTTLYSWSVLNAGMPPPFQLIATSCILLPKNQVLLVGSAYQSKSVAIFDVLTNSWEKLEDSKYNRYGSALVNLSGRIFTIDGKDEAACEEFDYQTKTWSEVKARTINQHWFSSALALPAEIFAHLPGGCEGIK